MIYSCGYFLKLIGNLILLSVLYIDWLLLFSLVNLYIWFVQNAGGATQDKAYGMAGAAQDKTKAASDLAGEKWESTKQASSNAAHAASNKAAESKDTVNGLLHQTGDAMSGAYQSVKNALTPNH